MPRTFGMDDQRRFARLSGDVNPIHMDALFARRTQTGAPVVHGIHAVLWTLDQLALDFDLCKVASVSISFNRHIYLDRSVDFAITRSDADSMYVEIQCEGVAVTTLLLQFGLRAGGSEEFDGMPMADLNNRAETPEALKGACGWLDPAPHAGELAAQFPNLKRAIGSTRVVALALLSAIVGMACPGLHSIFTGAKVDFVEEIPARPGVGFELRVADPRFRLIRIAAGGSGLCATLATFMRLPPKEPPSMSELAGHVAAGEFARHRVLVVGGSRGLGALSAKLVAAGGGEVVLTYARGAAEAAAVAADIRACRGDGACAVHAMDVTSDLGAQLAAIDGPLTGLLYFATPTIRRQRRALFTPALFDEFMHYYARAFADLTELLLARDPEARLAALYPSSIAVNERPPDLTEYAMAKAAGEVLARDLAAADKRLALVVERLPLLPTDQNAMVVRLAFSDPVATLLPLLRQTLSGAAEVAAAT